MPSDRFLVDGAAMSERLGIFWPDLLRVMNLESGISPSAGLGVPGHAIGVIQLMPANLQGVGWRGTREEFGSLSDFDQLPYVEKFLQPLARFNLHSDGRIHQALFVPATLHLPELFPDRPDTVLAAANASGLPRGLNVQLTDALVNAYHANSGFDRARKGFITVQDLEDTDDAAASHASSPFQHAIARLRVLIPGLVESGESVAQGVGAVPWLAIGTFVLLGVGGTMLLSEKRLVRLPRWMPAFMRG